MFGPHTGFIIASWASVFVVVGLLGLWLVLERRALSRQLADLEAREDKGSVPAGNRPEGKDPTGKSPA